MCHGIEESCLVTVETRRFRSLRGFERYRDFSPSPSVAPAKLIETYRVSIRSGVNQIALI
jgi:hypothetical protein